MYVLWPTYGLRYSDQEVMSVPVHGRERLEEDVAIGRLGVNTNQCI